MSAQNRLMSNFHERTPMTKTSPPWQWLLLLLSRRPGCGSCHEQERHHHRQRFWCASHPASVGTSRPPGDGAVNCEWGYHELCGSPCCAAANAARWLWMTTALAILDPFAADTVVDTRRIVSTRAVLAVVRRDIVQVTAPLHHIPR